MSFPYTILPLPQLNMQCMIQLFFESQNVGSWVSDLSDRKEED